MPNENFKRLATKVKKENKKIKKAKNPNGGRSRWSLMSLPNNLQKSSDDSDESVKKKSSENIGKLPTLTEEEITFFDLVQKGDSVGLKDFMKSPAYAKIQINKTDNFGFSALHHAVRRQDDDMVAIFLEQEGILTYDTIFHAITEENVEITKMLLAVQDRNSPPSVPLGGEAKSHFFMPNHPPPFFKIYGVPRVLSPLKINSQQDLNDWEKFDSEFPIHSTELMLSARKGNYALMELFYQRGQRLETQEYDHNCGCQCRICVRTDRKLSSEYEQLYLFEALTNPKYICFIAGKTKSHDPANYAMLKILKCRELENRQSMFTGDFTNYEEILTRFLTDLVDELRCNEETEIFFRVPDATTQGRLVRKYPRMWTILGLEQVDVIAHPHAQYIVQKEWDNTARTTPGLLLPFIWTTLELLARIVALPFVAIFFWFDVFWKETCIKNGGCCTMFMTPRSRYWNWIASYITFLGILSFQVMVPQRCHHERPWYWIFTFWEYKLDEEKDCNKRGHPNVGTEWFIMLYVLGIFVSVLKRNAIPWYWRSFWTWYELVMVACFVTTFSFWAWANDQEQVTQAKLAAVYKYVRPIPEHRDSWGQWYPEVLAQISLSISCILAWGYTLRLVQVERHIGPLQIAVGKMMKHFAMTAFVYSIVLFSFSSGLNAIYVPYDQIPGYVTSTHYSHQSSTFGNALHAPQELFWSLYGMSGSDKPYIVSFNITHTNGTEFKLHPIWSERAGRTLFLSFHILGVLMMFNMLVAFFTQGSSEVLDNADKRWKFARTEIHMIYLKDTAMPPPYNVIPTTSTIKRFAVYCGLLFGCTKDNRTASCSFWQCFFIKEPVNRDDQVEQKRAYRRLILQLIHRYNGKVTERDNDTPSTSDDVKELGEELAELKSQIQSKMREMQKQMGGNTGQKSFFSGTGGGPSTSAAASVPKPAPVQPAPKPPPPVLQQPIAPTKTPTPNAIIPPPPPAAKASPTTILPPPPRPGPSISAVNVTQTAGRAVDAAIEQANIEKRKKLQPPPPPPPADVPVQPKRPSGPPDLPHLPAPRRQSYVAVAIPQAKRPSAQPPTLPATTPRRPSNTETAPPPPRRPSAQLPQPPPPPPPNLPAPRRPSNTEAAQPPPNLPAPRRPSNTQTPQLPPVTQPPPPPVLPVARRPSNTPLPPPLPPPIQPGESASEEP